MLSTKTARRLNLETLEIRCTPHAEGLVGAGALSDGHVDGFDVAFEDGELELVLHDEDLDEEFAPEGTLFIAPAESQVTRPDGAEFDFTGVAAGEPFYVLPQTEDPNLLFLGAAAEEVPDGTFASFFEDDPRVNDEGEYVRVNILDVQGPGVFSMWDSDQFGTPRVLVTTQDGVNAEGTPSDTVFLLVGSHSHFNWGFSQPGTYTVTAQASGFQGPGETNPVTSEEVEYTFYVGEPGGAGVRSTGELDIYDIEFEDGELEVGAHDEALDAEFSPEGTLLVVEEAARTTRPEGSEFDFIGADAGDVISVLPQSEDPDLLFLGAGAEEIEPGTFGTFDPNDDRAGGPGEYILVTVTGVNGPGELSVYQNDGLGNPTVFVATSDGLDAADSLFLTPGDHIHYNWAFTQPGVYEVTAQASSFLGDDQADPVTSEDVTYTFFVEGEEEPAVPPIVGQQTIGELAVGNGSGVAVIGTDGSVLNSIDAFPGLGGPVRSAQADVDGDGVPDTVAATGPGTAGSVRVMSGAGDNAELYSFTPFEASFTGGLYVAAGDLNGDGAAEIVVSADETGGARVTVFDGATGGELLSFFGIADPDFRGGARVAVGDINGDSSNDLIVAAGVGGGPRVAVYDGPTLLAGTDPEAAKLTGDFFVFEESLRDGAFVAAGDINGDGSDDLVAGGGPLGGPRVFALDGPGLLANGVAGAPVLANFFAGSPDSRDGVRVAVKQLDGDGLGDLVVSFVEGEADRVIAYAGSGTPANGTPTAEVYDSLDLGDFPAGPFVG